jgi:hypothetical protein
MLVEEKATVGFAQGRWSDLGPRQNQVVKPTLFLACVLGWIDRDAADLVAPFVFDQDFVALTDQLGPGGPDITGEAERDALGLVIVFEESTIQAGGVVGSNQLELI